MIANSKISKSRATLHLHCTCKNDNLPLLYHKGE